MREEEISSDDEQTPFQLNNHKHFLNPKFFGELNSALKPKSIQFREAERH